MKKKIALFGPHDRFNYGDLLFAIMLEHGLNKISSNSFAFTKYSLVDADFTTQGGFKTLSYKRLKNNINCNEIDTVIVAGGESLRADWNGLYSFINPIYFKVFRHPRIPDFFKKNNWVKHFLGGVSDNPFLVNKSDFAGNINVVYNSVGGATNLSKSRLDILKTGDYLSFRENMSFQFVKDNLAENDVFLVPDSAIIMDDIYPKADFRSSEKIPSEIKEILKGKYVFFQISKYKNDNKLAEIAQQLKYLAETKGIKIVLCPIGTAKGHEDHVPLGEIYESIKDHSILIKNVSVEVIMALIAHSQLYIGNSLHGIITAMSYRLPYIALNKKQIKIIYYMDSWAIDSLKEVQDIDNFLAKAKLCLEDKTLPDQINEKTIQQKDLYYSSLERMYKIILEK